MIELREVAHYVSEKIDVSSLKTEEYITTDNMIPNRGGVVDCESLPQASRATRYEPGDILISNIRPYFKKIWFSDRISGCSNDVIVFRTNDENWNKKFLYYVLSQDSFFDFMMAGSNGTKMPRGNKKTIPEFLIPDFDIDKQIRIANLLSAYDSLIENNQKQIKLLEEAAQRLYKEWFVDLHFPGYEDVEIVDGVPEGWERKKLINCLEMHIGGGWGKETIVGNNTIPGRVIRGTDINEIKAGKFDGIPLRYHTENDKRKRSLKTNDIVFELSNGNINNIGRCLLIDNLILNNCGENTICASFCKLFRPLNRLYALIIYLEIQDMQSSGRMLPFKKQGSNGINNFAFDDFLSHELLVPNEYTMLVPIDNIISQISILQNQQSLLIQSRDRLLPKLMSGEIEV